MKNSKSFLVPVVAAIAALTSSPSFSAQQKVAGTSDASTNNEAKSSQDTAERMIQMVRGNELHDLILKSSESGQTLAYHYSHSSHSSHSSHYSSRY